MHRKIGILELFENFQKGIAAGNLCDIMGEDLQEMYFRNSRKKAAFMIAYQDSTKQVFKMSVPIFVELLLQLLVGNVDQFMVSHYSQNSVAAIGNANQVMNIVIIVLNVMSVATTILLSQY